MKQQDNEQVLSFEWHSLIRDLVRNFWLILMAGLIAWMGIYVGTHSIYSPVYTSSATLSVRAKVNASNTYTSLTISSEMAEIFSRVFTESSITEIAAQELGMEHFDGTISSSVLGETNLLNLSVTAKSPELAYRLLDSALKVYPSVSDEIFTNAVIDVLAKPSIPSAPSNTISMPHRGLFILLAMSLEAGIILLLSLLRDTVKTEGDFERKIDAKLLGTVTKERNHLTLTQRLKHVKHAPLINDAYSGLKFCEDFHKAATKLEYLRKHSHSKVFTVTSVAENEGKSTVAVNTAMALAERGYQVALLDMDVRKPALYKMLESKQIVKHELADVLSGKADPRDLTLYRYRKSRMMVAFNITPHSDTTSWISGPLVQRFLTLLRQEMDFVIIDTPPTSVSADAVNIASLSDEVILVVSTDHVASVDINDTILTFQNSGCHIAGCMLNNVHRPFALFNQMGADETGSYSRYHHYGYYGKYGKYGKYGYSYGHYGHYNKNISEDLAPIAEDPGQTH